jgi:hypothetical protein
MWLTGLTPGLLKWLLCWHLAGGPHPGSHLTDIGLRTARCTHDYRPLSRVGNEATTQNVSMVVRSPGQDSNPVLPKSNINIIMCVRVCVCMCTFVQETVVFFSLSI